MTTARLFTAYSTFTLISTALFAIGQWAPCVVQAYVSLQRIERYLNSPEVKCQTPQIDRDIASEKGSYSSTVKIQPYPVVLETDKGSIMDGRHPTHIVFEYADIGWEPAQPVLKKVHANVELYKLTMVIGRVAAVRTPRYFQSWLLTLLIGKINLSGLHSWRNTDHDRIRSLPPLFLRPNSLLLTGSLGTVQSIDFPKYSLRLGNGPSMVRTGSQCMRT